MPNPEFAPQPQPQPTPQQVPSATPLTRSPSGEPASEPLRQGDSDGPTEQRGGFGKWAMGAVAAGILAVGGFFFFHQSSSDGYTPQQAQQLQVAFQSAYGHMQDVNLNDSAELQRASDSLDLPAAQKTQLLNQVRSGQVKLGWVTVWDDMSEDGDVVEIDSAGYSKVVPIWHKPATIAVPYVDGTSIQLKGAKDGGGGGITVGISTAAGPVDVPPMTEGQVLELPLH